MRKSFQHLTLQDRDYIGLLKAEGRSIRQIAKVLKRSPSSISRELHRNAPPVRSKYYLSHKAQARSEERNRESHRRPRLKNQTVLQYVLESLKKNWSPEQIAGRLPQIHCGLTVSHEAIYQYIYEEAPHLISGLTRAHRRRLKRWHTKKHRQSHIPQRISITQRPAFVENRIQAGHWETDTVVSRQSLATLHVLVERKTRFTKITKINQKSASLVRKAINQRLAQYPQNFRRTITYDNGSENVQHLQVNSTLGTKSFFCQPFHSWEKGTVENTIGLIRRYFPKKTDFANITHQQVKQVEKLLNHRPRKCLSFKTPLEIKKKSVAFAC